MSEQEKHIDRFAEANQLIRGQVRSADDAWKQKQLCQNRTRPEMDTAQRSRRTRRRTECQNARARKCGRKINDKWQRGRSAGRVTGREKDREGENTQS